MIVVAGPRRVARTCPSRPSRSAAYEMLEPRRLADGTFAFGADRYDVPETAGSVAFVIARTGTTAGVANVQYGLFGGPEYLDTGTPGEDYTDVSGTVTFADGESSKTVVVPVLDDARAEGNEHITVNFRAADGVVVEPSSTRLVIHDDDSPGVLALDAAEYRVDEAAGQVVITVTRGGSRQGQVGVTYRAGPGGGVDVDSDPPAGRPTLGVDFTDAPGTLTFADGQESATFAVPIRDDALVEGDERFMVIITDPTGGATLASLADADASVIITDDDDAASPGGAGVVRGADPADPMVAALIATGTPGDDRFRFVGRRDGTVAAFLNGQSQGVFARSSRLVLDGGAGNDRVTLEKTTLQAWLYGGDGNDVLTGTRGNDVLVGGAGDDRISGGVGRDLLIGGAGSDRMSGGAGEDVLVAGTTAHDGSDVGGRSALANVLVSWSAESDYANRVGYLTSPWSGPALTPDVVFDDAATDVLVGQTAADVFFADTGGATPDKFRGKSRTETVVEV